MKIATAVMISMMLMTASPGLLRAADEPPALSHNPFSRPPSEVLDDDRRVVERDDGSGPMLVLQATMIGHTNRLANVAGRILKPGDEISGYKLIAVFEEFAIFERDGKSITVYVKPNPAEEDE